MDELKISTNNGLEVENHHEGWYMSDTLNSLKNGSTLFFENLKWLTAKEAAFYLRTSVGQIRNMVYRNQIRSYRFKNRLRFLRTDLDRLLKPQGFQTLKEVLWQ